MIFNYFSSKIQNLQFVSQPFIRPFVFSLKEINNLKMIFKGKAIRIVSLSILSKLHFYHQCLLLISRMMQL